MHASPVVVQCAETQMMRSSFKAEEILGKGIEMEMDMLGV